MNLTLKERIVIFQLAKLLVLLGVPNHKGWGIDTIWFEYDQSTTKAPVALTYRKWGRRVVALP